MAGIGFLSAAVLSVLATAPAFAQVRAFSEAEGFGATVTGGRAATSVYHVTNLNDSGTGSFRDAVSGSNRIIVFDVGGIINLSSAVSAKSNLTIAGQTAPGGGISINGAEVSFANQSNIICRYIHFRPGDGSSSSDDAVSLYDSRNVILDHASIQFGKWNNIDAVTDTGNDPNITIQNSIIANAIGQQFGAHLEAVGGHMTLSNNLWANNHNRNPLAKVNEQFKNNIEYNNEAGYTTHTSTPFSHDLVNNAFIHGPASGGNSTWYQLSDGDTDYASGNVQDTDKDGVLDQTAVSPNAGSVNSTTPNFDTTTGLPTLSVANAYTFVTTHAGASITRDDLDNLVISQVKTLGSGTSGKGVGTTGPTGGLYGSAASDGLANAGLGVTAAGTRLASFDADKDGVADTWEASHGMSSSSATDAFKLNPLGYLMVEQYLNELGSTNDTRTNAFTGQWTTAGTWSGAVAPTVMDYVQVRGVGGAAGAITVSSGTANAMKVSIGGNGTAAGESLTVTGGALNVYDTVTVGDQNNGTMNVNAGAVSAYNIVLGNTITGTSAANYTGTLNLRGGTLSLSQLVLGGGAPGAWTTGGSMNWTGGTLKAVGDLNVNVPIALGSAGGTLDSNGFDGTVSGVLSDAAGNAGALTKIGVGTVLLSGTSTYTGVTKISSGALAVAALSNGGVAGNLGSASTAAANLVLDGGTLQYTGAGSTSTDRLFTLTAKGGTLDAGSTGSWTFSNTGLIAASGTGDRTLTLTGSTTGSTFSSNLADPTGGKSSLVIDGTGRWIFSGGTRTYSGDTTVNTDSNLLMNAANLLPFGVNRGNLIANGDVDLNGFDLSINALNGAGNINQRANKTRTLTLGNGDASGSFSGTLTNTWAGISPVMNVTKTGAGLQTFTGTNSYTGITKISGGALAVTTVANGGLASGFGAAASDAANLVLDGGALRYAGAGNVSTDRLFSITANGGTVDSSSTGGWTFGSTGSIAATGTGDRTLTLAGTAASNSMSAAIVDPTSGKTAVTIGGTGRWIFTSSQTYSGDTTINTGSTLLATAANVLPFSTGKGNVAVNGFLELNGNNLSINALNGNGNVNQRANNTRTLTVGNGNASGSFSGTLTNVFTGISPVLNLVKTGTGTQTLGGVNGFSGATTVQGGTLAVNGSINSSAVFVNNGGTLGGSGSLLSVQSFAGGTIAPGTGIGTMTVLQAANLDGTLAVDLSGTGAGASDLLSVGGALDVAGTTLALSNGGTTLNDAAYVLASYGSLTGSFSTITGLPTNYKLDYHYNNGTSTNNIALVAAVPEPAGLAIFAIGCAVSLKRRRRA